MIRSALRLWPAQLTQIYIRLTKAMLVITHNIGVLVVKAPKILPKFWSISSWEFSSRYLFPSRFFVMDSPSRIKWFTISLLKIVDQPRSFYLGHLTWNPMHSFRSCTLQKIGLLRIGYTSFGAVPWTPTPSRRWKRKLQATTKTTTTSVNGRFQLVRLL